MIGASPYEVLQLDKVRRVIAKRMLASVRDIAHVTLHRSVDASTLINARRQASMEGRNGAGVRITLTAFIASALGSSLREYPRINGRTEEGEIRLYHRVNLGVAIEVGDGLVAPVIRDVDQKSPLEIAAELTQLAERAQDNKLVPSDFADITFTMTNLGAFGVEKFTPIINPPQLGILGVGAVIPTVSFVEGQVRELPLLGLSLSFDHAALDGAQAARFLDVLARHIETPVFPAAGDWRSK